MALVKLFGNLRQLAGSSTLNVDGKTVSEILSTLRLQHKSLVDHILDGPNLRPYYKIMVNGHDVSLAQGLDTPVQEEDVVAIFPPIAGGLE